ncbi:mechanosensitive ion channel family protein [Paracoccaceae bacterium GXU_MW_L88]
MEELQDTVDGVVPEVAVSQMLTYWNGFLESLPRLFGALIVLLLIWILVAIVGFVISRVGKRARLRRSLIEVLSMIASTAIWFAGILIAMTVVFPSITPAKALTALGLGSVAIGFAFKDVFENFLAGILILIREPFRLGDFIATDDIEGDIEEITIRDTRVRQTDGQLVVVPNAHLFQNPVIVRTDRDTRRVTITVGVAYSEDVDQARGIIYEAVKTVDMVRDDVRDVQVFAKEFGASSIDFEVAWWTGSRPIDIRSSRDKVVAAIKRALDDAEIEIPFPYTTLTFREDSPIPLPKQAIEDEA